VKKISFACLAAFSLLAFTTVSGGAQATGSGPVLSVVGDFDHDATVDTAVFERADLDAMPNDSFETTTIWTEGPQVFSGVYLDTLLSSLGTFDGTLQVVAINDYMVSIPLTEIAAGGALLATRRNGDQMSVHDKGPFWIVYPYDADDAFRNEVIYSRSVWQVKELRITPPE